MTSNISSSGTAAAGAGSQRQQQQNPQVSLLQKCLEIIAIVLRILLWPLRRLSIILFPDYEFDGLSPAVTAKAARHFVTYLKSLQPAQLPSASASSKATMLGEAWKTLGFNAAKEEAAQNNSLLFVYLHSPLHRSSQEFCRSVLSQDALLQFLRQPAVLAVGVSIHSAQGVQLAQFFSVAAYPFVALLQPRGSNASSNRGGSNRGASSSTTTLNLLMKAEGPNLMALSLNELLTHLQGALSRHEHLLAEQEARRLQREQEALLRRQQDEEYQEALRADQERERLVAETRAQERAARQAEESRVRQEQEAQQAVLDAARAQIAAEPPSGGAMVRFVLPSGQKLNRRFGADETIAALKAYITLYFHDKGMEMGTVGLSTNYPRKTYNEDADAEMSLEQAGLVPQAVLMVQDLDA